MAKITVCTQCYNTKPYLEQCINSVLNQTFRDFTYVIIDSASTDGSGEMLEEFAKRDSRIRLIRLTENRFGYWATILPEIATSPYFALIDSDDWWELDHLETLLSFLEENELDIACTGRIRYDMARQIERAIQVPEPLILSQKEFAQRYSQLNTYANFNWAALMKRDLLLSPEIAAVVQKGYSWYEDVMMRHTYLLHCRKIGIHNSTLYHYRIHSASRCYQYIPDYLRCLMDVGEMRKEFLKHNDAFTPTIQDWLKELYCANMTVYASLLKNAAVPADEKLRECDRILNHPQMQEALAVPCFDRGELLNTIWAVILQPGVTEKSDRYLERIAPLLLPGHVSLLRRENLGLFAQSPALLNALQKNRRVPLFEQTVQLLLNASPANRAEWETILLGLLPEGWPLDIPESLALFKSSPSLLKALSSNNRGELLDEVIKLAKDSPEAERLGWEGFLYRFFHKTWVSSVITDYRFLWKHEGITRLLFKGDTQAALELMAQQLVEGEELYNRELFLNLFLMLAAFCNQPSAFIAGKVEAALFYCEQGRLEECRAAIAELDEMGAGDIDALLPARRFCSGQ